MGGFKLQSSYVEERHGLGHCVILYHCLGFFFFFFFNFNFNFNFFPPLLFYFSYGLSW